MSKDLPAQDFSTKLRAHADKGVPLNALVDAWPALNQALDGGDRLERALVDATRVSAIGALAPAGGVATAVTDKHGAILARDELFDAWFGASDLAHELADISRAGSRALVRRVVPARDGRPAVLCAAPRALVRHWPLDAAVVRAVDARDAVTVLMGFSPSRASDLASRVARALRLSPLEARVAEALVSLPDIGSAARRAGVGFATARDAVRSAMRKAAVRRKSDLVRRVVELGAGDLLAPPDQVPHLIGAFGLTLRQAVLAQRIGEGMTRDEAARSLDINVHVAKDELDTVYAKTGVAGASDLTRLIVETAALATLTSAAEIGSSAALARQEVTRLIPRRRAEGMIAIAEYGAPSGEAVVWMHGMVSGRCLPRRPVSALLSRGLRIVMVERPGYGLTDAASGNPFEAAALDVIDVLDALKIAKVRVFGRDIGVATALALAAMAPARVIDGVLLNPRPPVGQDRAYGGMFGAVKRLFLTQPACVAAVGEMLRRQTRSDLLKGLAKEALHASASDLAVLEDAVTAEEFLRTAQAALAGPITGFVAEHTALARGWVAPSGVGGSRWSIVSCAEDSLADPHAQQGMWRDLPGVRFKMIEGVGRLVHFSRPDALAAAFD